MVQGFCFVFMDCTSQLSPADALAFHFKPRALYESLHRGCRFLTRFRSTDLVLSSMASISSMRFTVSIEINRACAHRADTLPEHRRPSNLHGYLSYPRRCGEHGTTSINPAYNRLAPVVAFGPGRFPGRRHHLPARCWRPASTQRFDKA